VVATERSVDLTDGNVVPNDSPIDGESEDEEYDDDDDDDDDYDYDWYAHRNWPSSTYEDNTTRKRPPP